MAATSNVAEALPYPRECDLTGCEASTGYSTQLEREWEVILCNDHYIEWKATDFDPEWLSERFWRIVCSECDNRAMVDDYLCERCRDRLELKEKLNAEANVWDTMRREAMEAGYRKAIMGI